MDYSIEYSGGYPGFSYCDFEASEEEENNIESENDDLEFPSILVLHKDEPFKTRQ